MSFIRSTSNPEGLYVYHDVRGCICISGPNMEPHIEIAPTMHFYGLVANYLKVGEPVKYGELRLREVYVLPEHRHTKKCKWGKELLCGTYKMELQFKRKKVQMWRVTWDYIARNAQREVRK